MDGARVDRKARVWRDREKNFQMRDSGRRARGDVGCGLVVVGVDEVDEIFSVAISNIVAV
jgi:hypothetical protein